MARQRKTTTGERVARLDSKAEADLLRGIQRSMDRITLGNVAHNVAGVQAAIGHMADRLENSTNLARRIDRAIAAAVRKERERCAGVMNRPQLTMQQRTLAIKEGR
jgi:hypothetical protein